MNATSDKLERVMAANDEARRARLAQMLKRSPEGPPGLDDAAEVSKHLLMAHNLIAACVMDAAIIAECVSAGEALPFTVTAEHVAALGLIAADARRQSDRIMQDVAKIDDLLWLLEDARQEHAGIPVDPALLEG